MQHLITRYNLRVTKSNKAIEKKNATTFSKWQSGEISDAKAKELYIPLCQKAEGAPNITWALRFKTRFHWRSRRPSIMC
eukprot:6885401-Pyramimonas_sp.AAC.1